MKILEPSFHAEKNLNKLSYCFIQGFIACTVYIRDLDWTLVKLARFLYRFWPLLKWATFLETAWSLTEIGLSLKLNDSCQDTLVQIPDLYGIIQDNNLAVVTKENKIWNHFQPPFSKLEIITDKMQFACKDHHPDAAITCIHIHHLLLGWEREKYYFFKKIKNCYIVKKRLAMVWLWFILNQKVFLKCNVTVHKVSNKYKDLGILSDIFLIKLRRY